MGIKYFFSTKSTFYAPDFAAEPLKLIYVNDLCPGWMPLIGPHSKSKAA